MSTTQTEAMNNVMEEAIATQEAKELLLRAIGSITPAALHQIIDKAVQSQITRIIEGDAGWELRNKFQPLMDAAIEKALSDPDMQKRLNDAGKSRVNDAIQKAMKGW